MNVYVEQLASTVRATRLLHGDVYWFGRRLTRPLPAAFVQLVEGADRDCCVTALLDRLYADFYCPGRAAPSEYGAARSSSSADAAMLVAALSAANTGGGYTDPGWELRSVRQESVTVRRAGIELRARRHDCEWTSEGEPEVGSHVALRYPKELTERLPGFYVASGNRTLAAADFSRLVRFYWNVTARGAVELMRAATTILNAESIPFQLKVLTDLEQAPRADRAVLYLPRGAYAQAIAAIDRIYDAVSDHLRPAVPALTKPLAPGVALAEDPGGGVSFGEHRCRLIAIALIDGHAAGSTTVRARLDRLTASLSSSGVCVERPYLMPGSDDLYASALGIHDRIPRISARKAPASSTPDAAWMRASERIADRICRDAAWSDGACNWLGAGLATDSTPVYGSLGPALYGGASGVALFLAELAHVTGDSRARETALGAMRYAMSRVETIDVEDRPGLFTGWTGIGLAAARVALLSGDESLLGEANHLLRQIRISDTPLASPDIISGAAGAIVGLLASRRVIGDLALMHAIEFGDALLASASRSRAGWSWRSLNRRGEINLTGISHGAAGIAWALFELARASGDARYRHAADMACAYERSWFDTGAQNWRDLRGYPARGTRHYDDLPCGAYWCHGAPGIALSRLRAFQLTGDTVYRGEAIAALTTTCRVTERSLEGRTNFSLCHGAAGNADVLVTGADLFGAELPQTSAIARRVAACGIERCGDDDSWPSGAGAATPSLMLGLAGVGHFYLHLARRATPSVLLLDVDAFVEGHVQAAPLAATR